MKVVLTVLARDEADVIDAQLAFHLNAGVDFVIATDHRSGDGTTEILEGYARERLLRLIRREEEEIRQSEWVTHMARLAATEHGADWVLNADADEFWWPRGGTLREVLEAVPERYGIVRGVLRNFLPRPDDGAFFAERMTVRLAAQAPINDPTSPYRPYAKVAHRADPHVVVGGGNHDLVGSPLVPLPWWPIEILHFPLRSLEQCEQKYVATRTAWSRSPEREPRHEVTTAYEALREGRLEAYYGTLAVDDGALATGLGEGSLAVDVRLRDALRALRAPEESGRAFVLPRTGGPPFPPQQAAGAEQEASYAADVAVLGEAATVRLHRRLDRLEQRLHALELRRSVRLPGRIARLGETVLARG
jgi:hypothetical protein